VLITGGFDWPTILTEVNPEPYYTFPMILELFIAYNLTWLPLIGDYSRYARTKRAGGYSPVVGLCAAQYWFYSIGALSMAVVGYWDPSAFIAEYGLGQGMATMLFMVVGAMTTNAVLLYSAIACSMNVLPGKAHLGKSRWILLAVFAAIAWGLCYTAILDYFVFFLYQVSGVLIVSFFGVVVADFLYMRHSLNVEGCYERGKGKPYHYKGGFNWRGVLACFITLGILQWIYFYHFEWCTWFGILLPGFILSAVLYLGFTIGWPPAHVKAFKAMNQVEKEELKKAGEIV
jgi:purine-cytosine permease-like protein